MCLNHEVVVFQSQIGTAPDLGSVANYTFYYNSPAPPVSTKFMNIFIYPLYPTSPQSLSFVLVAPLSCNRSPPPLLEQSAVHLDVTYTHHPPAYASCLYTPHRVPTSAFCPVNVPPPPFMPSAFSQVPVSPWGVLSSRVPPRLCDPASYYLIDPPYPGIF